MSNLEAKSGKETNGHELETNLHESRTIKAKIGKAKTGKQQLKIQNIT